MNTMYFDLPTATFLYRVFLKGNSIVCLDYLLFLGCSIYHLLGSLAKNSHILWFWTDYIGLGLKESFVRNIGLK